MSLRIGSLCSGYGGLELGVQSVYGGTTAWVSDIDKGACKILAHRFPGVPNIGDMTTVDWAAVEPVDLICGGTPCQDLSHAGKRAGMSEGTRSNLWVAMREAIATIRPKCVVWENVRGAYSAAADSEVEPCPGCVGDGPAVHLRALGRVLGDLSDLGYDASWHGLRAADVGAPHGRFRVFVVATDTRDGARHWERPREESWQRSEAVKRHPFPWSEDALCAPADTQRGGRNGRAPESLRRTVQGAAAARGGQVAALLPSPRTSDTNGVGQHGEGGLDLRTAVSLLPTPLVGSSSPAAHGQISGQWREQMAEALQNWGQYADAIARWESVVGPAPAPTELGPKGSPRLSAAFSEWMMGVPVGWITDVPGITRTEALKAAGNGVVPQQAAEALRVMASWQVAA